MSVSDLYLKTGDRIAISYVPFFNNVNGQQQVSGFGSYFAPFPCPDISDTLCLGGTTIPINYFVVKLKAINTQKNSFQYDLSDDSIIHLGDVVGLVYFDATNPTVPTYLSPQQGSVPSSLNVTVQDNGWSTGSNDDLYQVWLISDASNMGFYNSGCDGTTSSTCGINPTCGLQPPTNIPIIYGQSYVIQNYGQMVDQTIGGNNYDQWYFNFAYDLEATTNINRISDTNSKPSENASFGYFITFTKCDGTLTPPSPCENYFETYNINPFPLPENDDPVDKKGAPWWVYVSIAIGLIILIIIAIVINSSMNR
jgi:hypothetical protein